MDPEQTAIQLAELRGSISTFRDLFGQHTDQDAAQFSGLRTSISGIRSAVETLDGKIDDLLIREAGRAGEIRGVKQTAIVMASVVATFVSILIGLVGMAAGYV